MKFKRLFSPITINGMELKNRVVMPAFDHAYTPDGFANDRLQAYYNRRAEGGVAMVILGGCRFDDYGPNKDMPSFQDDKFIPGYREFAKNLHKRGAKVAAQLYHSGAYNSARNIPEGCLPLAPSAIRSNFSKQTPKEMSKQDIEAVIKNWAAAALRVKKSNFDAVEILGSAGYLISQFLSPTTNTRSDEYGGSWENRTRFPIAVLKAVRAAVGPDFPVIVRIAGNDFVPGANGNEQAVEFAKTMEAAGADMINVTGGWHETTVPQLPGDVPRGAFTYLAEAVKKAVNIPVMACNRISDPTTAEQTLALNKADLIGSARALVADPDWVNKAGAEKADEIRHCVACVQGCLSRVFFDKPVECLVNGLVGREYQIKIEPTAMPKKILVVGAGPAGMEVALTARERGHDVTVWEAADRIGGQLYMVAAAPGKYEFSTLIDFYKTMAHRKGIKIELNKKAGPDEILKGNFNEVVIATGALPNRITLPGDTSKVDVVSTADIMSGEHMAGKNVVIVGGSASGCEVAQFLARQGSISPELLMFLSMHQAETPDKISHLLNSSSRNVSVIDIDKRIGAGFELGTGWPVMKDLGRLGVKQYPSTKILEVKDNLVLAERTTKDGEVQKLTIPCDTIVLSVGAHSNNQLYEELKDSVKNLHVIGDARKVSNALGAIKQAIDLGAQL